MTGHAQWLEAPSKKKASCNNYVHRSTTILVSMFIHFGARTQTMARGPIKEKLAVTILFIETIQFLCRCSYVLVPGHTQWLEAPPFFGGWSSFLKRDNTILLSMLIHLGAWTHTMVIGPGRAQKKPHGPCMFPARAQSTPNLCTINVQLTLQKTTVLAHLLTINVQLTYS